MLYFHDCHFSVAVCGSLLVVQLLPSPVSFQAAPLIKSVLPLSFFNCPAVLMWPRPCVWLFRADKPMLPTSKDFLQDFSALALCPVYISWHLSWPGPDLGVFHPLTSELPLTPVEDSTHLKLSIAAHFYCLINLSSPLNCIWFFKKWQNKVKLTNGSL